MPSSTTRTVSPAVNTVDYSALESLEAINHRLKEGQNRNLKFIQQAGADL